MKKQEGNSDTAKKRSKKRRWCVLRKRVVSFPSFSFLVCSVRVRSLPAVVRSACCFPSVTVACPPITDSGAGRHQAVGRKEFSGRAGQAGIMFPLASFTPRAFPLAPPPLLSPLCAKRPALSPAASAKRSLLDCWLVGWLIDWFFLGTYIRHDISGWFSVPRFSSLWVLISKKQSLQSSSPPFLPPPK